MTEGLTLLPCPFCGGKADILCYDEHCTDAYCLECGAAGGGAKTQSGAIAAWNRRPAPGDRFAGGGNMISDGFALVPLTPTPAMLDVAVSFALMVKLSSEYNWSQYMADVWQRMISAAPAAPSGWISIEDALPKAQKPVLIRYLNHHGKLTTTMGWYCPARTVESGCFDGEVNDEYDDVSDTYYMKEQWVDESAEGEYHYPITGVTHWMPIPAPKEPA